MLEADYVIEAYGTGAVMGVPAHDERDARFAAEHGIAVSNAEPLSSEEAASVGRPAMRYRLRDWLISRQRYWGPPIPIVHCPHCGPVVVPDDQLPVVLPHVDDFRPTGTGESPLAQAHDWVNVACPACGAPARRETDVSDTFVDSAWYFLRYPSTEFDDRPWDPDRTARILPVDFYAGGPEHVQRHHLYARFVTMALHDLGLVPFEEPFPRIRLGGMIVRHGAKMSKSRGNVVTPDDYIDAHGADVLALRPAVRCTVGTRRRLRRRRHRRHRTVLRPDMAQSSPAPTARPPTRRKWHTRSSTSPTPSNDSPSTSASPGSWSYVPSARSVDDKRVFVRLLAPFAPHLAEELWHQLGEPFSVHTQQWPNADAEVLERQRVEIVVQIDGRVRGTIQVASNATENEVTSQARHEITVLSDLAYTRVVFVPNRVINFVTSTS